MRRALFRLPRVRIRAGFAVEIPTVALLVCLLCLASVYRLNLRPAPCSVCNVRDFGAKGDGVNPDTGAIQAAIDAASERRGAVVLLPPGRYVSGTLHLRSNISLRISKGAILVASPHDGDFDPYETPPSGSISRGPISWTFADKFRHRAASLYGAWLLHATVDNPDTTYTHYSLILGDHVSNIAIEGFGVIDGNRVMRGGPKLIALRNCRQVLIRGLTLRNAPSYNVSLLGSEHVDIDNLRILNGYADGIDPDNSRFVRIAGCYIDTWDDAICAKASLALGRRLATVNLVVTNCILRTSNNGLKFGTESEGDLRNARFTNCLILRRDRGRAPISGVAIESVDGGTVEHLVVSNVAMLGVRTPIFLRLGNRGRGTIERIPGQMRGIEIRNVVALDAMRPSSINGLPGFPIRDLTLANITVADAGTGRFAGLAVPELAESYPYAGMFGMLPAYSLYARHVQRLSISNWRDRRELPDPRPAAVFDAVSNLRVRGFHAAGAGRHPPIILRDVSRALIEGSSADRNPASVTSD